MFKDEKIYIAGPECFYTGGYEMLGAMRKYAESKGFGVTLPNDHPLDMGNPDLQKRADSIFADLKDIMLDTTVVIADLEAYRGSEADSGTIYELGMAYGKGARCYGYTRDKRPLAWKDQKYVLKDGVVYDEYGKEAPYKDLPFSPAIIGSTKIIEGDFGDCLHALMTDIEEEKKQAGMRRKPQVQPEKTEYSDKPVVYISGAERYDKDSKIIYENMKKLCEKYGLQAYTPADWAEGVTEIETDCPYTKAANYFDSWQQHIRNCDAIIANLNDYRGYECSNDVGFECGMAFQLGKKMYGYMDDIRPAKEKIPNLGEAREYRDMTGASVENFNYPQNLMFSCSMKIIEGSFEHVIEQIAEEIRGTVRK